MFNMEFDDVTLSQELQEVNCLFSDVLVDICAGEGVDHLFDDVDMLVAVSTTTSACLLDDERDIVCQPVSYETPTSVPVQVKPTKRTKRLKKIQVQGSRGSRGSTTTTTRSSVKRTSRPTSRNAARERSRVKSLRSAFLQLQNSLPSVPPDTKLSKLDVLVLATTYIAHLMKTLDESATVSSTEDTIDQTVTSKVNSIQSTDTSSILSLSSNSTDVPTGGGECNVTGSTVEVRHHRLLEKGYLHPVRKWPMRSRLYAGAFDLEKRGQSGFNGSSVHNSSSVTNTFKSMSTSNHKGSNKDELQCQPFDNQDVGMSTLSLGNVDDLFSFPIYN